MKCSFVFLFIFLCAALAKKVKYEFVSRDSIPELKYLDTSVDPCDNFYQYTCGNFKNVQPKPEGSYIWDHFMILQQEIHATVRLILESPRRSNDPIALQKAKAAYKSCVDTDYLDLLRTPQIAVMEELGMWPLLQVDYNDTTPVTLGEIGRIVAKYGVPLIFNFQVLPQYYDATSNMIYIYRDAVSNPQTYYPRFQTSYEDYLDKPGPSRTNSGPKNITPFGNFLRTLASRLRYLMNSYRNEMDMFQDLSETIGFMMNLQSGGITAPNLSMSASIVTVAQLQEWTDENLGDKTIDWLDYLNNLFSAAGVTITETTKVMHTPSLTYGVLNLFQQTEGRVIRNFIMTRLLTYMAPDGDEIMRIAFDNYYKNMNYDTFPRWEYCLRKVVGYPDRIDYSMALTYEYQRYHFNVNKLAAAADLVVDLMAAFEDTLREQDWMDKETREHALLKLHNMYTLLGYPEYAEDSKLLDDYYDRLRVCTWEHFGNSQRSRSFGQTKNFELIGKDRNREIWNLSPLEVNAFYNRANNRILFPASILNPVFFGGNISTLDYGRIGAIIGHEITHGYDKEGRMYDEQGLIWNWWTTETENAFAEKTECFLDQYSKYYIEEIDQYVNATQTLNENIADNGGLRQAYKALKKLLGKTSSIKTVEDFTPEQLFFIGYGTMWCMTETDYYLNQMHKNGGHAPGRFRVIGAISNMPEFADAFNCPAESNMNPKDKCVLW